ncbi:translation initiation factor eIF4E, variant 2 [Bonamia ostreae]|uniref:Translation initiation factor eIF4E, variant 2 n=1 Tax=Bonamia ostreae TaxID=126728 RepID=A0ABV2AG88_9EUKA
MAESKVDKNTNSIEKEFTEKLKIDEVRPKIENSQKPIKENSQIRENENKQHDLNDSWVLWYSAGIKKTRNVSENDWMRSLEDVCSFKTVEEFWEIFDNLRPISMMEPSASFYLFKDGIKPTWEDDANKIGGRWMLSFRGSERDACDEIWLFLVNLVIFRRWEWWEMCSTTTTTFAALLFRVVKTS